MSDSTRLFERRDFKNIAVILLIALVIGVYLIATTVVISKDGVFYIERAQQFASDPIKIIKTHQPGYPFLISFSCKVASIFIKSDSLQRWVYCAQSVSLLFRLAALIPIYFVSKFLVGSKKSFLAMLILVFLPYPAEMGSDVLREWPHLLFLFSGLLFFILSVKLEKRWLYGVSGLLSGLGFIIRPECAQIVVYALVWLCIQLIKPPTDGSRLKTTLAITLLMIGFCIPAIPYMQAAGRILPPKVRDVISMKHVERHEVLIAAKNIAPVYTCSVGNVAKGTRKLFERVNENFIYFFTLPAMIGVCHYFRKTKTLFKVFVPACFIVFYLIAMHLLYYNYGYISRRHCLPLVIMLLLFIPDGLELVSKWLDENVFKNSSFAKDGSGNLFIVLLILGISIGVPKLLRPLGSNKEGYLAAAEWLKGNSSEDASVFCTDNRVGFYAERKNLKKLKESDLSSEQYLVEISKKGEGTLSGGPENVSEEYSGWVDPKDERKRITIYKRM